MMIAENDIRAELERKNTSLIHMSSPDLSVEYISYQADMRMSCYDCHRSSMLL